MLIGQQDQAAESDPWSQDVRERDFHSGLWHLCFGGSRSWHSQRPRRLQAPEERRCAAAATQQHLLQARHVRHASGLRGWREWEGRRRFWQRQHSSVAHELAAATLKLSSCVLASLIIACGLACNHRESPQASYEHAYKTFVRGDLKESQDEAHRQCQQLEDSNPEWAWKSRILEANSLLWQGMYGQALATVDSPLTRPSDRDSLIEILAIEGAAHARLHQFAEAEAKLGQATRMCQVSSGVKCGDVIRASGILAVQRGQIDSAKQFFWQSLQFARVHNDHFLEATALLNLGLGSLRDQHYDEAIDWTDAAYQTSSALGA